MPPAHHSSSHTKPAPSPHPAAPVPAHDACRVPREGRQPQAAPAGSAGHARRRRCRSGPAARTESASCRPSRVHRSPPAQAAAGGGACRRASAGGRVPQRAHRVPCRRAAGRRRSPAASGVQATAGRTGPPPMCRAVNGMRVTRATPRAEAGCGSRAQLGYAFPQAHSRTVGRSPAVRRMLEPPRLGCIGGYRAALGT